MRTVEERTDRLFRRQWGWTDPKMRKLLSWQGLSLGVALRDAERLLVRAVGGRGRPDWRPLQTMLFRIGLAYYVVIGGIIALGLLGVLD